MSADISVSNTWLTTKVLTMCGDLVHCGIGLFRHETNDTKNDKPSVKTGQPIGEACDDCVSTGHTKEKGFKQQH